MIKFLFKAIILPILFLLAIPLIILGLMYQPMDNPLKDLSSDVNIDVINELETSLKTFLESENQDQPVVVSLSDDEINGLLIGALQGINANYLETEDYVIEESLYGFSGVWVNFKDDQVEIQAKLDVFVPLGDEPFVYQTGVRIVLEPEIDLESVTLTLKQVSIGNLPILWIFDVATWVLDVALDLNVNDVIEDLFSGFGTFDASEKSVTIDISNLIETQLSLDASTKELVLELITFVSAASLIEFKTEEDAFELSIGLQLLNSDVEPFVLNPEDVIETEEDFQPIFETLFDPYAIAGSMIEASLLNKPFTPYVDINEYMLNQLIGYTLTDLTTDGVILSTSLGDFNIEILKPFMRNLDIHVPFSLTNTLTDDAFISYVIIGTTFELAEANLEIELTSIQLGTLSLEASLISSLLANLPDNDMLVGSKIVIKDLDALFGNAGISLESIVMLDQAIRIYVTASETLDLSVVTELVDDILEAFTENPNIPAAVSEAANEVLAAVLSGDTEVIEAEIENLLETFETLTEEEQAILSQEIQALIENSDIDFTDLFNFIPE
jgi:hypothetical protein